MAQYDRSGVAMIRARRAWVVVRLGRVLLALCRAALHNLAQGALTLRRVRVAVKHMCYEVCSHCRRR